MAKKVPVLEGLEVEKETERAYQALRYRAKEAYLHLRGDPGTQDLANLVRDMIDIIEVLELRLQAVEKKNGRR